MWDYTYKQHSFMVINVVTTKAAGGPALTGESMRQEG